VRGHEQGMDVIMTGFAMISGHAARPVATLIPKAAGTGGGEEEHPDLPSLSGFLLHKSCVVSRLRRTDM